jgi:hypothetical protein
MIQTVYAQAGTTLFHIAAGSLGDATQWFRIALVNQIQDPFLYQSTTLKLPSTQTEQGHGSGR